MILVIVVEVVLVVAVIVVVEVVLVVARHIITTTLRSHIESCLTKLDYFTKTCIFWSDKY
jgi:hypothetical protein